MREINGDLWEYHEALHWVVIPTNGAVRVDGACVMGRGVALQAKRRFTSLPYQLGTMIGLSGNHVFEFSEFRIYSFPVKHHWKQKADLELIRRSAEELQALVERFPFRSVFLPQVGCGAGRLDWSEVGPVLLECLNQQFTVLHYESTRSRLSKMR